VALELAQVLLRHGIRRRLLAHLAAQLERAPDPLHVHADHAAALALAPERGDREPGEVAHLAVGALAHRVPDGLAECVEVELVAAAEALLAQAALDRLLLDRPEEEAVEDQVEDAPVVL
jgi:hypothetical protein